LEIVTIHPSVVIGPTLIKEKKGCVELIGAMLRGETKGAVRAHVPFVDVRDVAVMHYLALEKRSISGARILAV